MIFAALIPLALSSALAVPGAIAPAGAAPPARPRPEPKRWETLPLPPEMPKAAASGRVAAAGGAEIYYATFGKVGAPPVILLHGGLGNGDHYAHQVPALAERFRVIAIDSRGQGRSTLGKGKLTYAAMASDVIEVMKELKLEKASVAGWSDGGAIALALAIAHPRASIGCSCSPPTTTPRAASPAAATRRRSRSTRPSAAPTWRSSARRARSMRRRRPSRRCGASPASFSKDELRSIKARALIGDGDRDEIIELAQIKEMAELLLERAAAGARGHEPLRAVAGPAAYTKALLDFLTAP